MKHIDRLNLSVKNMHLIEDFGMPDYSPREYPCSNCGRMLKLIKSRVLYCRRCRKGTLHPGYNFNKDAIQ